MGLNTTAALKGMGFDVKKTDITKVNVEQITFHPKGHPLWHPRSEDPIDEALRDDIAENGVKDAVVLRMTQDKMGDTVLEIVDGCRRTMNAIAALPLMRKSKSKLLDADDSLFVKVEFFAGTDAELLIERQRRDRQPWKKQHSLRVLVVSIVQMCKLDIDVKDVLSVLPREWTARMIADVTLLWHTASPELLARLDKGDVPAGLLPTILKAKGPERLALLEHLVAEGVTSNAGATRKLNATARERTQLAGPEDSVKPKPEPRVRVKPPVQAVHPKTVRKIAEACTAHKVNDVRAFGLGARAALGGDDLKAVIDSLESDCPTTARAVLAGILYRQGHFGPNVQKHVHKSVLEIIENAAGSK